MRKARLILLGTILTLLPGIAASSTTTNTVGRICESTCPDKELETYREAIFKGTTIPSNKDQQIVFLCKRANGQEWHRFGTKKSYFTGFTAQAVTAGDGRWRFTFMPTEGPGFSAPAKQDFFIKAKFLPQDGFESSSVRKRVTVRAIVETD